MSTFKVGQRARIKWSQGWPELAGQEGVVTGFSSEGGIEGDSEYEVAPLCWGTSIAPTKGVNGAEIFGPNSSQLEPIQYDGNKTVQWSECLWRPSHSGAPA